MRANFIFSEVWIGLRRNLTMTVAVIVTVAIGMALLGVGLMINAQVSNMKDFWADKVEISAFLCSKDSPFEACKNTGGVTEQERETLRQQIQAMPEVQQVYYEDAAKAYQNFKTQYGADSVLVAAVKVEDMPESFRVKVKNPESYTAVMERIKGAPGVSNVVDQKKILEIWFSLLERLRWSALAVAFILVFAAILLIGNTVRLSAYNRRRETGIMRLVGASNLYIQLPFVMEGMIAGLVGGVVAATLLIMSKVFLFESVGQYLGSSALGWNDVAWVIMLTMAIGVIICVMASFVTLRRYLRV
ncbi:cell division protein FtsX [Spongiactinospora gelatinilytica]|uniref:Cell division protein FtsX n=1 Tax=Spongiactinospora gelatinilytica TaxID=2666298 RepID=A0A2W2HIZ0_9ACTN|nr:permease-like cell division protein FtsX [Spongiactinospora gelatinilytica]PZG50360.1 cell division protein FtsX [Spongiactinospora gelatinilytica]